MRETPGRYAPRRPLANSQSTAARGSASAHSPMIPRQQGVLVVRQPHPQSTTAARAWAGSAAAHADVTESSSLRRFSSSVIAPIRANAQRHMLHSASSRMHQSELRQSRQPRAGTSSRSASVSRSVAGRSSCRMARAASGRAQVGSSRGAGHGRVQVCVRPGAEHRRQNIGLGSMAAMRAPPPQPDPRMRSGYRARARRRPGAASPAGRPTPRAMPRSGLGPCRQRIRRARRCARKPFTTSAICG